MTQAILCPVDAISDGTSKGFQLENDKSVFVVGDDGAVFVYLNECPHLHVNLEWQEDTFLDSEGKLIECATHGALFEMNTGHCIVGPCEGESLTAIPHRIEDGQIVIDTSSF